MTTIHKDRLANDTGTAAGCCSDHSVYILPSLHHWSQGLLELCCSFFLPNSFATSPSYLHRRTAAWAQLTTAAMD